MGHVVGRPLEKVFVVMEEFFVSQVLHTAGKQHVVARHLKRSR